MSLELFAISLFNLVKNEHDELIIEMPTTECGINAKSECLVMDIHRAINEKTNKGFGFFKEESNFLTCSELTLSSKAAPFTDFTQGQASRLLSELCKYPFADTGLLVFAHYRSLATEYLMVSIVPFINGMTVDPGLHIQPTNYIDVSKITIAARIDFTAYRNCLSSNRYISFLRGRTGRGISDFFFDFLEIECGLEPRIENAVLKQAVEDFISSGRNEPDEAHNIRKAVKEFAFDAANSGEEIVVADLSGELPAVNGADFASYVEENGYELSDSFPANKAITKGLVEFKGAGGGLKISFDRLLLTERIFYDAETDTLTIKGTPPNLRDQLVRAK
ncbi:nucleoid-associated protein YejK [Vibrio coralliilyticus]|uniref:nucleoid-associated protein YejK n=1 Tax=Vibrio coralliilyticus TaxID=190893 RepID=UPI001E609CAE|nr:nucleoid-associated protein YejK [Vibrio coralliilyticus]MCC2521044.1 nucleoid-associated protein YejK [Vibrio coralliilyticus]